MSIRPLTPAEKVAAELRETARKLILQAEALEATAPAKPKETKLPSAKEIARRMMK